MFFKKKKPKRAHPNNSNAAHIANEEALIAQAIAASLNDVPPAKETPGFPNDSKEEEAQLAEAIAASQEEAQLAQAIAASLADAPPAKETPAPSTNQYPSLPQSSHNPNYPLPGASVRKVPAHPTVQHQFPFQQPQSALPSHREVKAVYDFEAVEDNELKMRTGDCVAVLEDSDPHWWKGQSHRGIGFFPSSFVTENEAENNMSYSNKPIYESPAEEPPVQIDEDALKKCLHLLQDCDPTGDSLSDPPALAYYENLAMKMAPMIDKKLAQCDKQHNMLVNIDIAMRDVLAAYDQAVQQVQIPQMPQMQNHMQHQGYGFPSNDMQIIPQQMNQSGIFFIPPYQQFQQPMAHVVHPQSVQMPDNNEKEIANQNNQLFLSYFDSAPQNESFFASSSLQQAIPEAQMGYHQQSSRNNEKQAEIQSNQPILPNSVINNQAAPQGQTSNSSPLPQPTQQASTTAAYPQQMSTPMKNEKEAEVQNGPAILSNPVISSHQSVPHDEISNTSPLPQHDMVAAHAVNPQQTPRNNEDEIQFNPEFLPNFGTAPENEISNSSPLPQPSQKDMAPIAHVVFPQPIPMTASEGKEAAETQNIQAFLANSFFNNHQTVSQEEILL